MPQAKISFFFKRAASKPQPQSRLSDQLEPWDLPGSKCLENPVAYKRRHTNPDPTSGDDGINLSKEIAKTRDGTRSPSLRSKPAGKILNKKRNYAQYHLELGQSDFLLHSCAVCGIMYARGDEEDEKVHKKFHNDYYQGIQFKVLVLLQVSVVWINQSFDHIYMDLEIQGWQHERVVSTSPSNEDRIVLVLDGDPPAQTHKVQQVVKVMERDLGFGDGQLIHKLCKVYLYISSHRIVGCLIAEPIKTAHRVISGSSSCNNSEGACTKLDSSNLKIGDKDLRRLTPAVLQFGNFLFKREVIKKDSPSSIAKVDYWDTGAILCEEAAVPAFCGIRAIWVVPSNRRKGLASLLLDAARNSFCVDRTLEHSEFAFSSPTSAGRALASSYTGNKSFLVYTGEDV